MHAQSSLILASELLQNSKGFSNLGGHGFWRFKQMKEFKVIHLQQHASDLASQLRFSTIDRFVNIDFDKNAATYGAIRM
jgi:hypothetical protein